MPGFVHECSKEVYQSKQLPVHVLEEEIIEKQRDNKKLPGKKNEDLSKKKKQKKNMHTWICSNCWLYFQPICLDVD